MLPKAFLKLLNNAVIAIMSLWVSEMHITEVSTMTNLYKFTMNFNACILFPSTVRRQLRTDFDMQSITVFQ